MATASVEVSATGGAITATITYDDATLLISQVSWTVLSGTIQSVTVSQPGKPDVTSTNLRASGSKNVNKNAGYTIDAASIAVQWESV